MKAGSFAPQNIAVIMGTQGTGTAWVINFL